MQLPSAHSKIEISENVRNKEKETEKEREGKGERRKRSYLSIYSALYHKEMLCTTLGKRKKLATEFGEGQ
jgi:hypothetical protein